MNSDANEQADPESGLHSGFWTVLALVIVGGAAPLLFYWLSFGRVATVTAAEAKGWLRRQPGQCALVDVRRPEAFLAGHLEGATNWPVERILALRRADEMPPSLRGKRLLLICDVGWNSARAAAHLAAVGAAEATNVRGGIQEWTHATPDPKWDTFDRWQIGGEGSVSLPFRASPLFEQAAAVIAFFLVKPIYTLLALAIAVLLWRCREADLAAVRWGMIAFFLGENACAVNYFAFKETSILWEYLHSFGMAVSFGFLVYAVLEGFDRRVLMLGSPERRCAAVALCGLCAKRTEAPCGLERVFCVLIPAIMAMAFMLPTADWHDTVYNTRVFGQPYNYAHLRLYQVFEQWYCAGAAIALLGASLAILVAKGRQCLDAAKIAFAAGLGPLAFGAFRMILGGVYDRNRVWYLFWEECTELLLILAVGLVLWIFRRGLFAAGDPGGESWPAGGERV
jgi:rhodanese-related sulfurtransferase